MIVREKAFRAVLRRAGISEAELARRIGVSRQVFDRMVHGQQAASPRVVRDAALALASLVGEDPAFVRAVIFTDEPDAAGSGSLLDRRLAAALSEREGEQT